MQKIWSVGVVACTSMLTLACWGSPTAASYVGGNFTETITIGTWDRTFHVHVPERATAGPVAPLIIAFHGLGQTALQLESQTGLDAAADEAGAIVVYPEAALGSWDISGDFIEIFGINDLLFMRTMIDRISSKYVIDHDRVVAVGLSNGAVFAERLGCELSDEIVGFVSVAGTMARPSRDVCHPDKPVGALYIIGTNDTYFPINGDDVVLSVDSTMAFWAGRANCSGRSDRRAFPDTAKDGTIPYRSSYLNCNVERGVAIDSIVGSGHGWPGSLQHVTGISRNLSANQEIIQFVMAGRARPR